jgi:hypothetical protein
MGYLKWVSATATTMYERVTRVAQSLVLKSDVKECAVVCPSGNVSFPLENAAIVGGNCE